MHDSKWQKKPPMSSSECLQTFWLHQKAPHPAAAVCKERPQLCSVSVKFALSKFRDALFETLFVVAALNYCNS